MRLRWFETLFLLICIAPPCGVARAQDNQEPSRLPKVIVFTDGTRIGIRAYEIQDELVVFTTLEGQLRSVPLSFVDLAATRTWNASGSSESPLDGRPVSSDYQHPVVGDEEEAKAFGIGVSVPPLLDGPPAPVPPEMVNRDGQGRATMRAVRLGAPLVVDGKLEDPIYRRIPGVEGFLQAEPDEGAPTTERTQIWVSYDDGNVYISGRCWDSHPERMVANEMRRDNFGLFLNENFAVVLDTFYDRRNAFFFYTNPLGGLFDGLITDETDVNRDWNTVWDVKTSRFENGWTVEMAIPFKSLRYPAAGPQVWGINFRRIVRWKNEYSYLTQIPASYGPRGAVKISSAATLVGLETPPRSKNLELKPYLKGESLTDVEADPPFRNELDGDFGFDRKGAEAQGRKAKPGSETGMEDLNDIGHQQGKDGAASIQEPRSESDDRNG